MALVNHVPAENIDLLQVGHGYIELRQHRFAAVYRITKGINFIVEENSEILKRINVFENVLRQLGPNEEIEILFKRVPADSSALIHQFQQYARDQAPRILQETFNPYYRGWMDDFTHGRLTGQELFSYEVYVLFSIDFSLRPYSEQAFNLLNNLFSVFQKGGGDEKTPELEIQAQQLEEVRRRAKAWITHLSASGVEGRELTKSEIYRLLYHEINLQPFRGGTTGFDRAARVSAGVDGFQTLREMLTTQAVRVNQNSMVIGEKHVRTISVKHFPEKGQDLVFLNQLLYQRDLFKVTLFVRGIEQEFAKSVIKSQMRHDLGAGSDGQLPSYEASANLHTRNAVMSAIARGETGLARMSLFVSIYADDEKELRNKYEALATRLEGIHTYNGSFQQDKYFFSTLPLAQNLCKETEEVLQTTSDISNAWPFFYDSLTLDKGVVMGYTQSSEPFMLDPWLGANENYNIGIFGMPGTGKSYLIQLLLNRVMPKGPDVMVIDRSGTYATSCQAQGGEYILLDLKAEKHINVFDTPDESYQTKGTVSEDQQEAVAGFLTTLLVETGESSLKNAQSAVLLEAIKKCYKRKWEEEKKGMGTQRNKAPFPEGQPEDSPIKPPRLRDFRRMVLEMAQNPEASSGTREFMANMAEILLSYVEDGTYARLTDQETNIHRNNPFLVFDTSLGQKNEKIKILTTYIVSTFCFNRAREIQKRGGFPMIVIDEFWDLLSFAAGRTFADILSRTSRHLSLCTIFATQMIADCLGHEQSKTALNVASTKIFLKLGDADRALCQRAFELGDKELSVISDLKQVKGFFSMGFLKSTSRRGLVYIVPDPVCHWMGTSYPVDKNRRKKYMERFNAENTTEGCWRALFELVRDEHFNREPEFLSGRRE